MSRPPSTAILHPPPSCHSIGVPRAIIIDIPLSISLAQHRSQPLPTSIDQTSQSTTANPTGNHASTSVTSETTSTHPDSPPNTTTSATDPVSTHRFIPQRCFRTLLSSPAPTQPYPSTEPKSEKARQRVLERQGGESLGGADEAWIEEELVKLRGEYGGEWCLERRLKEDINGKWPEGSGRRGKKRKRVSVQDAVTSGEQRSVGHDTTIDERSSSRPEACPEDTGCEALNLPSIIENVPKTLEFRSISYLPPVGDQYRPPNIVRRIDNRPSCNSDSEACFIDFVPPEGHEDRPYRYIIPPESAFLLSNISSDTTSMFSSAAQAQYRDYPSPSAGPGQFDFILLDPPWANRSVRRSRKYSTMESYNSSQAQESDPMAALEGMLGQNIAPHGLVGCWITNKPAVRKAALAAFDQWGVKLTEEWTWLKVTTKGEPVTELGGIWRKPYEVLLLGRKGVEGKNLEAGEVKKRLIAAVPDLHSRKPNLKELIEPLTPEPANYRALEIFARNLTAGWFAWGAECLKYNWDGYWKSPD